MPAVNVTLLAFATKRRAAAPLLLGARRPPLSIDISCPERRSAANPPYAAAAVYDGTDRQTDGRLTGS